MKNLIISVSILATLTGCRSITNKTKDMAAENNSSEGSLPQADTTPKVTGIGGIFFFSENPGKTREWYSQNLGLEVNQYGSSFKSRNLEKPEEINYLQWSPFAQGSDYFSPSKKEFMINYRVQNIEGLVAKLKKNGVTVLDQIETYDYGKFVHIMDEDGNKIELWEPIDTVSTEVSSETTKEQKPE